MSGGKQRQPLRSSNAYTVIEVMIFLAISGVMFLIAATFINGKQARASFHNNVNNLQILLETAINDVENGSYPALNNFQCIGNPAASSSPSFSAVGPKNEGQNLDCFFLGKTMNLDSDGNYTIVSVAGNKTDSSGNAVTLLNTIGKPGAFPVAIAQGTDVSGNLSGLSVPKMCTDYTSGSKIVSYGFGLIGSLNANAGAAGSSGSTVSPGLYAYGSGGLPDHTTGSAADPYASQIDDAHTLYQVIIYVTDGSRYAALKIGDNNGLAVNVTYLNSVGGC